MSMIKRMPRNLFFGPTPWIALHLIYVVIASFMPVSAFRQGFTNGLMSESMILWFLLMFKKKDGDVSVQK